MLFTAPKGRVGCLTGSIRQGSRHMREWVPNLPVRRPHPAGVAAGRVLERGVKGEGPPYFFLKPGATPPLSSPVYSKDRRLDPSPWIHFLPRSRLGEVKHPQANPVHTQLL